MKLQEIDIYDLYLWAEETAFSTNKTVTSLIGFAYERIIVILKYEHVYEQYKFLEKISEYFKIPSWDRMPVDDKKFKSACKALKQEKLLELFFELGRLQGIRQAWAAIENEE